MNFSEPWETQRDNELNLPALGRGQLGLICPDNGETSPLLISLAPMCTYSACDGCMTWETLYMKHAYGIIIVVSPIC